MAWSPLLIDPAHREPLVAALHAAHLRGEGMTDSPHRGACPQPGEPALEHALDHPIPLTRPGAHRTSFLRPEQHAPSGVGVKDLRPLRGRPPADP